MRNRSFLTAGIAVGMLFASNPVLASDDEGIEPIIEEVIVTASLLGKTEGTIGDSVDILNGDELSAAATAGIGGLLDDFLGVSVTDFGGAVSRPTIRGFNGDRVKVLSNGVVTRDVSGIGADHGIDVDLFNIEQIEVIRGPSSLLYTNGAIGGIVNIVDNTIASTDFTDSKTVIGMETQSASNGQSEFISFEDNIGGLNVTGTFKNSDFENYEIPNGAILHAEEMHEDGDDDDHDEEHGDEHGTERFLENSDYGNKSMRFGVSKVGSWGHIGASVRRREGTYGVPFHGESHSEDGHEDGHEDDHDDDHDMHEEEEDHDEHEGERIFATTRSDTINLEGSFLFSDGPLNNVEFYFRDSDYSLTEAHAEEEGEHGDEEEEDEHAHEEGPTVFANDSQEFGAIFDFSGNVLTQKLAIEVVSEDTFILGEEAFMSPVSSDEFTAGYYASREVGGFVIDLGIRNDWIDRSGSVTSEEEHGEDEHEEEEHEEEGAETQYYSTDSSSTSIGLQAFRQLNDNFDATLSLSSVERAPSAQELYMNGAHLATARFEVGNPNLDDERSNSVELNLNYAGDNVFSTLTVYRNDVDDYVYLQDESEAEHEDHADEHAGLTLANYVQQDAEFTGFEFEIGTVLQIADGDLTLSYGRDSVSAEFKNGGYVPRINPNRNLLTASYQRDGFDLDIVFKDVDAQTDIGSEEDRTAGYQMLDVNAANVFALSDDLDLTVSVFGHNLLNEIARNHSSFVKNEVPLPGRSYGLKFYATF